MNRIAPLSTAYDFIANNRHGSTISELNETATF